MVSDAPVEVELDTSEVAGDRECSGGLVGDLGEAGDCSAEDDGSDSISVIFLPAML